MQEFDQQQARAILKDQGARFLDYLAAVSQTFAARTPQRVEDSPFCILSSQIPVLPNLIAVGPASSGCGPENYAANKTQCAVRCVEKSEPDWIGTCHSRCIARTRRSQAY